MGPRNAHRAKDVHGTEQLNIDIKPRRADSFVYQQKDFDVTNLVKYIEKKKKSGEHITYFHAFVTAIAKCIYNRNKLNRFVQNRHIFEHNLLQKFNSMIRQMKSLLWCQLKRTIL